MALFQKRALQTASVQSSDNSTYTLKLPNRGALSALEILIECTNGSTSNTGGDVFTAFDKIEIIANGSYQILSLTPLELFQWGWLHYRRAPSIYSSESGSEVQKAYLTIPFGLPLLNKSHYLPLDQYDDLELRISYSPTISATAGFATGTATISVYAIISENPTGLAFTGYLRTRTVYTYTTAASGEEKIRISGQYPLLGLLLSLQEGGISPHANITDVEVTLSDGAVTHFVDKFQTVRRRNMVDYNINGAFTEITETFDNDIVKMFSDSDHLPTIEGARGNVTAGTDAYAHALIDSVAGNWLTISAVSDEQTGTHAAQAAYSTAVPYSVHSNLSYFPRGGFIGFGYPDNLDQSILPSQYEQVHLKLTDGNAGAAVRLSQLELAQVVN